MSLDGKMEPRIDRLTAEMNQRSVKAQLRLEIWRRLNQISYSHTEKLLSDLVRKNILEEAFAYLQRHQCPLGFADPDQCGQFMTDLQQHISGQCLNTASQEVVGVIVVIGGGAARLYSEGRWLQKYERSPPQDPHARVCM